MAILNALYTIVISPLELLFEVIFMVANKIIGNEGVSIIFLSLAVNFLVLPLYKRADELQNEERDIQAKMAYRIKRTKQTFKGDERFMMLQEYYRINNYKPIYALKSSASLLLQIPFFIAAYRLLSGMQSLQGMSFGFIADLGKEDATFMIGSFPVNILPIVMTLINIVTGIIYTKGQPLKSKIQVYGLAVVFLVLLYHSPAGLVFYWLLNNVFALVKNIFYKLKEPRKILYILLAAAGAVVLVLVLIKPDLTIRQKLLLGIGCVLLAMPLALSKLPEKLKSKSKAKPKDALSFVLGTVLMACITGLLIPSTVINASAEEFFDVVFHTNPTSYIFHTLFLAIGSWVLWGGVFYFFMSDKMKSVFSEGIWIICGVSIADYMLFGTDLGTMSSILQYDVAPDFKITEYLLNTLAVIAIAVALHFIYSKLPKISKTVLAVGILSIAVLGGINISLISYMHELYVEGENTDADAEMPVIPLSKDGYNVIVIMLDRSLGTQVPYIFNEKPELKETFDGFTVYPNTISYGPYTLLGSPALYGGYEYTPEAINARDTMTIEEKHNEALRVMPVLFGRNGYTVTVCDPSHAGFKWTPDLSIYDDHPEFNCYNTDGMFNYFEGSSDDTALLTAARVGEIRNRNFFFFSLMKISPLLLQDTIYDGGLYNESVKATDGSDNSDSVTALAQSAYSISTSSGYDLEFLNACAVLENLPKITVVSEGQENTFLMMANKTAHSPCLLQEPDYVPAMTVDNTAYDTDMVARYTIDGVTMEMSDVSQVAHYQANMASFIELGKWFDFMREQGVYDNTRIIIVADHGRDLSQFDVYCNDLDMEFFMPTFLVKDFNATGFTVSEEFMTNGDTPTIATAGIIEDPVNPFTNKPINSDAKNGPQTVFFSEDFNPSDNYGRYAFPPGSWYVFDGTDPLDPDNWEYLGDW